jgi:hypothetical protein
MQLYVYGLSIILQCNCTVLSKIKIRTLIHSSNSFGTWLYLILYITMQLYGIQFFPPVKPLLYILQCNCMYTSERSERVTYQIIFGIPL